MTKYGKPEGMALTEQVEWEKLRDTRSDSVQEASLTYLQFTSSDGEHKLAVREDQIVYYAFTADECKIYFDDTAKDYIIPRPCRVSRIDGPQLPQEPAMG